VTGDKKEQKGFSYHLSPITHHWILSGRGTSARAVPKPELNLLLQVGDLLKAAAFSNP
jgi:hypothetical protein